MNDEGELYMDLGGAGNLLDQNSQFVDMIRDMQHEMV